MNRIKNNFDDDGFVEINVYNHCSLSASSSSFNSADCTGSLKRALSEDGECDEDDDDINNEIDGSEPSVKKQKCEFDEDGSSFGAGGFMSKKKYSFNILTSTRCFQRYQQ
jgi:hypothetical protein